MKKTMEERDAETADKALAEAEAQVEIIKILKPLNRDSRWKVMMALNHLERAEEFIPGILEKVRKP